MKLYIVEIEFDSDSTLVLCIFATVEEAKKFILSDNAPSAAEGKDQKYSIYKAELGSHEYSDQIVQFYDGQFHEHEFYFDDRD